MRLTEPQAKALLWELCVRLGFCLPAEAQRRLEQAPPEDVDAFADAVFTAEGMDPRGSPRVRRQVCDCITAHFRRAAGISEHMVPPPHKLDGANVLFWTSDLIATRSTGRTAHRIGGEVLGPAAALAICRYGDEPDYYLFYCDYGWTVRADTCHPTLEDAKRQAEFEYEGVTALWRPAT